MRCAMFVTIAAVLLLPCAAQAGSATLKIDFGGVDNDPAPIKVYTAVSLVTGTFSVNLSAYTEKKEETPAESVHQKYVVRAGTPTDGFAEDVTISEPGFTRRKLEANLWVLEKDGLNSHNPVIITVKARFATPGKDKEIRVDGEVKMSKSGNVSATGKGFLDAFNLQLNAMAFIDNAAEGEPQNALPFDVPPYGKGEDDKETTTQASCGNADIKVRGPFFGGGVISAFPAGYYLMVEPGYKQKFNDQGNRNATAGGMVTVKETGGKPIVKESKARVNNGKPRIVNDNVPPSTGYGKRMFAIVAGDPCTAVNIQIASEFELARELGADIVDALAKKGYTKLDISSAISKTPSVQMEGGPVFNVDGSVQQNASVTVSSEFYLLVRAVRSVCSQGFLVNVKADIRSKDGQTLAKTYSVSIE
ncbi:MAG: hypothetical protein FJY76_01195 [Candidatus Aenigmarchaeota archaeon]|nr:hypothetical protein [Candidatus Aenigmarchaeota archaeon]